MPKYTVRRNRWFRHSDEKEVTARDEDHARELVRAMDEVPPREELEHEDHFYEDEPELIANFGLEFATWKDGQSRVVMETDYSFTTKSEAAEHARDFFHIGPDALLKRRWWKSIDAGKIKVADVVMATIVAEDGERGPTYYRPGFLVKEAV
jgi:hypothetical protein